MPHLFTVGFFGYHLFLSVLMVFFVFCLQRPPKLSIGPPHPDPIVETSSLSAVQPPEPTYDLRIKEELEESKALSCLQIETLVYACQVAYQMAESFVNGLECDWFLSDVVCLFVFYYRGIFSTLLMVPERAFLLEMVLVWGKGGQLLG